MNAKPGLLGAAANVTVAPSEENTSAGAAVVAPFMVYLTVKTLIQTAVSNKLSVPMR